MSSDDSTIDIRIEGNTMHVAHEMYNLGNIARVSTYVRPVGFDGGALKAIWLMRSRFIFIVIGLVVLSALGPGGAVGPLEAVLVLAALATIAQIVLMLRRKSTEYVLLIESSGVVRGLLASEDNSVIDAIKALISDSIRNPPITAKVQTFHNVNNHIGDVNTNQYGAGSIAQQFA